MKKRPKVETLITPCNGCVACCRKHDIVFLRPELGDKASQYKTQVVQGKYALAHTEQGDCVYLELEAPGPPGEAPRGRCSIWEKNRPAICRAFDCAEFLFAEQRIIEHVIKKGLIDPSVLHAALERVTRGNLAAYQGPEYAERWRELEQLATKQKDYLDQ